MAYTSINKPTDHFEAKTYDGTGASRTLAYDFEVDFFWCKMRNDVYPHNLSDVVRGNLGILRANATNAEVGAANSVSFDNASGITLGSDSSSYGVNQALNDSSVQATYVGYGWKADNTSGSSNTNGSITSTVSANTTSGFSIVSYTGTGSNATVGHGLGAIPKIVIIKNRDRASSWHVGGDAIGSVNQYLNLNDTNAIDNATTGFQSFSSTTFGIGNDTDWNASGESIIAYCFAEKKGFSKFGSYTGNGSTNGTFVYTGFKPAMVIIKNTSIVANWQIYDNKRSDVTNANPNDQVLNPNSSDAEYSSGTQIIDTLSNGFKCRGSGGNINGSGNTLIYMAFAESPFTTSTGVPTTAR